MTLGVPPLLARTPSMLLRQTALRASVLPRTALSRLAARQLCMHDDFKPKTKSYAGADGDDIHAQVRRDLPPSHRWHARVRRPPARAQIAKDVAENKVVVFMKGVPDAPQCGFSNTVTQASTCCL